MHLARWHLDAFMSGQRMTLAAAFEHRFSGQDEEELPGARMEVAHLAGPGRHRLLDDREARNVDESPPIAACAPHVVLGIVPRSLLHGVSIQVGIR